MGSTIVARAELVTYGFMRRIGFAGMKGLANAGFNEVELVAYSGQTRKKEKNIINLKRFLAPDGKATFDAELKYEQKKIVDGQ